MTVENTRKIMLLYMIKIEKDRGKVRVKDICIKLFLGL